MIIAGTILLLQAAAPASETLARGGSIELPPPIEAEMRPYRQCLVAQFDLLPGLRTADAEIQRELNAKAIAACAEERRSAVAASDASLQKNKGYRKAARREAAIARTFRALDEGFLNLYLSLPSLAPAPRQALSVDQAGIVYDQCLARAAARASATDAAEDALFGLAKEACSEVRAMLLSDAGTRSAVAAILDSIEAERSASFSGEKPEDSRDAPLGPAPGKF